MLRAACPGEVPGRVASGPDKAMACRYCQMARVWRAWRKGIREEPTYTPLKDAPGRTWRIWAGGDAHPFSLITEAGNSPECRRD